MHFSDFLRGPCAAPLSDTRVHNLSIGVMNEMEVHAQINQMVQFIHQEAKEKAAEIKLKTDEEFNIEKLRMVEAEKQKIRADYERKEKQEEVKKRMCVPCRQSPRISTHQPSLPPSPHAI